MPAPPDDFDWVTALAACSLDEAFDRLLAAVKRDVEIRNRQTNETPKIVLHEYPNQFAVSRGPDERHRLVRTIRFLQTATDIHVKADEGEPDFHATLTLNPFGLCCFVVDSSELAEWEFRKKALEGLLFG